MMPPPQTPSRSYYMPVPDRNNPVALPRTRAFPSPFGRYIHEGGLTEPWCEHSHLTIFSSGVP
jgi:hypothetical protein